MLKSCALLDLLDPFEVARWCHVGLVQILEHTVPTRLHRRSLVDDRSLAAFAFQTSDFVASHQESSGTLNCILLFS